MEQFRLFLEKAEADPMLMTKIDELGLLKDGAEKISELGRENGFSFTPGDVNNFIRGAKEKGQVNEKELEEISGGGSGLAWCVYCIEYTAGRIFDVKQDGPTFWGLCTHRGGQFCTFIGCRCWGTSHCVGGWHKCEPNGHWLVGHGWSV